jgi:4-amino-4-deoxy-L-arabinose transferase-like glycosyltransferase
MIPFSGRNMMETSSRRGIGIVDIALVVLLAGCVSLWVFFRGPVRLQYPDSMEYAQIARSLANGNGYRTETLWLSRLSLPGAEPDTWVREGAPDVRRPPLFVWWEALGFKVFGVSDRCAIGSSVFWFALSAILLFVLAARLVGKGAAWWAVILYLLDRESLILSTSGLTEPLFAALLLLLALALTLRESLRRNLLIGIALALLQLTRHNGFTLILPLFPAFGFGRQVFTPRRLLCLAGPLVLTMLILGIRSGRLTGIYSPVGINGWSIINGTDHEPAGGPLHPNEKGLYPNHYAERSISTPESGVRMILSHPRQFLWKWLSNLAKNLESAFSACSPIVWILLIPGMISIGNRSGGRELSRFALGSVLVAVIFFSLGEFEGRRFYVPFTPLLIALAAGFFSRRREEERPALLSPRWGWILLPMAAVYGVVYLAGLEGNQRGEDLHRMEQRIKETSPGGGLFLSDVPWAVGWFGNRTTAWLPWSPEDIPRIRKIETSGIVLSSYVLNLPELSPEWREVFQGVRGIPGFQRKAIQDFPGFVLFTSSEGKSALSPPVRPENGS